MDAIAFVPSPQGVTIVINGRSLIDLAREVELPHAMAEENPGLAGSYTGMAVARIHPGSRHFLGEPVEVWFEDGDTVLLGCDCGEWGCWPLTADIEVGERFVIWQNFRQGHRDWDLSALGPFRFSRSQYEAVLAR